MGWKCVRHFQLPICKGIQPSDVHSKLGPGSKSADGDKMHCGRPVFQDKMAEAAMCFRWWVSKDESYIQVEL